MSYAHKHTVEVTTAADGSAEVYSPPLTGRLVNVIYTKPASDGLTTANFTITAEGSGIDIWAENGVDASKIVSPTQDLHDQSGDDRLYESAGEEVGGPIYLCQERVKIVIASGGDDKKGTFDIIVVGPTG